MSENKVYVLDANLDGIDEQAFQNLVQRKNKLHIGGLLLIVCNNDFDYGSLEKTIPPAFRMTGFIILNFHENHGKILREKVIDILNKDPYIDENFYPEEINIVSISHLIKEINDKSQIAIRENNISRVSIIKPKTEGEKMADEKIFKPEETFIRPRKIRSPRLAATGLFLILGIFTGLLLYKLLFEEPPRYVESDDLSTIGRIFLRDALNVGLTPYATKFDSILISYSFESPGTFVPIRFFLRMKNFKK